MSRVVRAAAFAVPSAAAVFAATVVAGLAEGAAHIDGALMVAAAGGFAAWYAIPFGLAASLALRGLWHAWRPGEIAEQLTEETGGAPRLAAWVAYALIGLCVLSTTVFNTVRLMSGKSDKSTVVALGTALVSVVLAGALVAVVRPCVDALTVAMRALDRKLALRPRRILAAGGAVIAGALLWSWKVSIEPRIGHLELGAFLYVTCFVVVAVAVHAAALVPKLRRRFVAATLVVGVAATSMVGSAVYLRHYRPFLMLDLWATVPVGGLAIDLTYDLEEIRLDLNLDEIEPVVRPGADHPDIVLVTVDTVRADRTPTYGGKAKMAAMSKLGRRGAVFDWAFSPGNVTRRSLPTLATGVAPRRMSGRVAGWALRLDPRHVLLAERLRAGGYQTAGFFCCRSQFGAEHRLGLVRGLEHTVLEWDGAEIVSLAIQYISDHEEAKSDRPLFLWLHLIEPHGWEKRYPSKKYGNKPKLRYDKSLAAVDLALAPLLRFVEESSRRERTVLVLTSDHGEGLGDHRHRHHSTSLYNAQIRVPLIFAGPGIEPRRIRQPVGLVDLVPTLMDLAGFVPMAFPESDGVSLAPLLRGESDGDAENAVVFADQVKDRSVRKDIRAVIRGRHKLIVGDGSVPLLFDILADPKEKKNLASTKPKVVEQLRALLAERAETDAISPFGN